MNQMDALNLSLSHQEVTLHESWREHSAASSSTAQSYRQFQDVGREMRAAAREAAAKVKQLQADDTIFPEGRDRLVREASEAARAKLTRLAGQQTAILTVMDKELESAATPRMPKDREMAARDEARMVLDAASDPLQAMTDLAQRGDELAAVVAGSYGESYLRARGQRSMREVKEAHGLVRLQSVIAGQQSADPQVRKAACAYAALNDLRKAAVITRELAWSDMTDTEVAR